MARKYSVEEVQKMIDEEVAKTARTMLETENETTEKYKLRAKRRFQRIKEWSRHCDSLKEQLDYKSRLLRQEQKICLSYRKKTIALREELRELRGV